MCNIIQEAWTILACKCLTCTLAYMWWHHWWRLMPRNVLEYSNVAWCNTRCARFGRSTHISMISNSVTHLRSYTNSAITGNSAPISPVTLHNRRLCIERRYRRIEWRAFHNVLRMFHDVLLVVHDVLRCITMFYDVSQCFTCVSWCLTIFYHV